MVYILIGFATLMLAQNWLPALITAGAGLWAANKSNKAQKQAVSAQQGQEAYRQDLAQQQMSLADRLLYGQDYVPGQGVHSRPDQGGAMGQAQSWTDDYLGWLKNSPDITYNAQRSAMEGNIRDSMEMAGRAMGRRGLNTANVQSGAALQTMGGLGMARAGLLANLEAGRHDRQGERLATGSQLTQSLMDRALNVRSGAMGTALNQQTQIPGMMMGQAAQYSQQAGAFGNLTGTLADYYMQSRRPSVQIPTTVPMQGGQNQFSMPGSNASFKPTNAGYQSRYWGN